MTAGCLCAPFVSLPSDCFQVTLKLEHCSVVYWKLRSVLCMYLGNKFSEFSKEMAFWGLSRTFAEPEPRTQVLDVSPWWVSLPPGFAFWSCGRVLSCWGFGQPPHYQVLLFLLFAMHRSTPQILGSLAGVKWDIHMAEGIELIHKFLLKAIVYSLESFREKQTICERKFSILMAFLYLWAKNKHLYSAKY